MPRAWQKSRAPNHVVSPEQVPEKPHIVAFPKSVIWVSCPISLHDEAEHAKVASKTVGDGVLTPCVDGNLIALTNPTAASRSCIGLLC